MEENNMNGENRINNEDKHICFESHCWKKCLAMVCAAFLGGFLAFYFVADQMMYKYHSPRFNPHKFEKRMFDDMDRMYKQDMKAFEDAFDIDKRMNKMHKTKKKKHQDLAMPAFFMDSVKIKTEFEDNKFNVVVDLKPFQGDENKVNYNVEGRKLTVFGNSEVKDKDYEHEISFSQDFILPENADIMNITKIKDGNNLIVSVPMKEQ